MKNVTINQLLAHSGKTKGFQRPIHSTFPVQPITLKLKRLSDNFQPLEDLERKKLTLWQKLGRLFS